MLTGRRGKVVELDQKDHFEKFSYLISFAK